MEVNVFFYYINRYICLIFQTQTVETQFVKIKGYTQKKKKTVDLRTTPAFLSAVIHENTT